MKLELLLELSKKRGFQEPINGESSSANSIQAEEDVAKEVVEATTFTNEDVHGGEEATNSIEESPSSSETGKEEKNELSSGSKSDETTSDEEKESSSNGTFNKKPLTASDILSGTEKASDFVALSLETIDEIVDATRFVLRETKGSLRSSKLSSKWDAKKISKHINTKQYSKIANDKKCKREATSCLIFIDLSGSFSTIYKNLNKAIKEISAAGYSVTVMDCGNGFNEENSLVVGQYDMYHSRERLSKIIEGTQAKLHPVYTTPSIEDAIKLVNEAELSIIIADYDGFSSISEVSYRCQFEKIPYFFDFENRYEYPEDHDWVSEEYSDYKDDNKWYHFHYYLGTPAWEEEY